MTHTERTMLPFAFRHWSYDVAPAKCQHFSGHFYLSSIYKLTDRVIDDATSCSVTFLISTFKAKIGRLSWKTLI